MIICVCDFVVAPVVWWCDTETRVKCFEQMHLKIPQVYSCSKHLIGICPSVVTHVYPLGPLPPTPYMHTACGTSVPVQIVTVLHAVFATYTCIWYTDITSNMFTATATAQTCRQQCLEVIAGRSPRVPTTATPWTAGTRTATSWPKTPLKTSHETEASMCRHLNHIEE